MSTVRFVKIFIALAPPYFENFGWGFFFLPTGQYFASL